MGVTSSQCRPYGPIPDFYAKEVRRAYLAAVAYIDSEGKVVRQHVRCTAVRQHVRCDTNRAVLWACAATFTTVIPAQWPATSRCVGEEHLIYVYTGLHRTLRLIANCTNLHQCSR